jgi:putative endonuclease
VGYTKDLKSRIKAHDWGDSKHTSKFKPWRLLCYLGFANEKTAKEFEYYLKTGSGRAFLRNIYIIKTLILKFILCRYLL